MGRRYDHVTFPVIVRQEDSAIILLTGCIAMPRNSSPGIAMHPNSALPNWDALLCTRAYRDSAQCTRPIVMNFRAADASRCVAHQLRGRAIGRRYRNSRDLVEDFCIFADAGVYQSLPDSDGLTYSGNNHHLIAS